jgi:hypothetical protein
LRRSARKITICGKLLSPGLPQTRLYALTLFPRAHPAGRDDEQADSLDGLAARLADLMTWDERGNVR